MEHYSPLDLETYFAEVDDPRVERTKRHKLLDSSIIAICGMICGAEGWVEMEEFGKEKEAWLKTILELPNGIPSHDTFGRVFARLDPVKFEECFFQWVQSLSATIAGVIAIDGKTLRRSHDATKGKKALHMGSRMGGGKSPGAGASGGGRKIERDYCHPEALKTISPRRVYCHH